LATGFLLLFYLAQGLKELSPHCQTLPSYRKKHTSLSCSLKPFRSVSVREGKQKADRLGGRSGPTKLAWEKENLSCRPLNDPGSGRKNRWMHSGGEAFRGFKPLKGDLDARSLVPQIEDLFYLSGRRGGKNQCMS